MKSIYELLMQDSLEGRAITIKLNREMIERIFNDWKKIDTGTRTLVEGRLKSKQKYPDLNDLLAFLWDKKGAL